MIKIISFISCYISLWWASPEKTVLLTPNLMCHIISVPVVRFIIFCVGPLQVGSDIRKKNPLDLITKLRLYEGSATAWRQPRDSFTPPLQVCGNERAPLCANMHASVSVWAGPNTNQCYRRNQGLHSNSVADQISVLSSLKPIISSFQHISSGFFFFHL